MEKINNKNKKVVVVMGASGAGKSRLAIDMASHFVPGTIEIVNADSMQVYRGLDVLTNKVPACEQKGIPHHLLGTVDANAEFSSRDFRDLAVPIVDDILARGCLPVIVGGTNYYIQALVSSYLIDDVIDEVDENSNYAKESIQAFHSEFIGGEYFNDYDRLMELDPVAANRIHPNDHRKTARYLALYESTGILPSDLLQGKAFGVRRLRRLQTFFGWNLHYVDATQAFEGNSDDIWATEVVEPCTSIVKAFVCDNISPTLEDSSGSSGGIDPRELWTQFICEACGNRVLRGAHEWEQHRQGRSHRKRASHLRKRHDSLLAEVVCQPSAAVEMRD